MCVHIDDMKINENYLNLNKNYLFSDIAKKVAEFKKQNPKREVYRLNIGDVTLPLVPAVTKAIIKANSEMSNVETFRGYAEEQGYEFLRKAVCGYYAQKGVALNADEVFISDGAKSDLGNILDIFSVDNSVLIPDPVYPVYVDTNIMAGRNICFIKGTKDNNFLPLPDYKYKPDIIYLCSPNNPTGSVYNKEQLKTWVDYALHFRAIILFDSAYEAFISDPQYPTSIYEINGAKECAIEFCSLSKTAGFTGTRCGYTVVPEGLKAGNILIKDLWLRRQTTKFNGVPYIIQRGAEAVFSKEGLKQIKKNICYYMQNAKIIEDALADKNIWYTGGRNSPYIWLECPKNMISWEFFDFLLNNASIAGTPGSGFGKAGEGFFRLTVFGNYENIKLAMENLKRVL